MSSLLNKAKDAMGKSGGSSGSTGAGQQSGVEKGVSGQAHTRKSLPSSSRHSFYLSHTNWPLH
jgi:hypothetical protein